MTKFKLAMVQLAVGASKSGNIARAVTLVTEAARKGAHIVTLPEFFSSAYKAEPIPGPSTQALSEAAEMNSVFVVGGTVPETDAERTFNSCAVYNPKGKMIAKHRKVHLFDVDVTGEMTFTESERCSPGDQLTMFDTPFCRVGVGICYDIRFAEMAQIYANKGCQLLVFPGDFSMVTGPKHWQLLLRVRAVDNQVFVAAASRARNTRSSYVAWGHSCVVDPWGEVIAGTDEKESIVYADIDLRSTEKMRKMIPLRDQKRQDLYLPSSRAV